MISRIKSSLVVGLDESDIMKTRGNGDRRYAHLDDWSDLFCKLIEQCLIQTDTGFEIRDREIFIGCVNLCIG